MEHILITGCSTGIGHDAAIALAHRGHHVIAACRKKKDVENLVSLGIPSVQMDVSDSVSITKALKEVLILTGGRIDVLINNAGYGQVGALEDVPSEALQAQFATNVFGLMELTRLVIPIMRQQNSGRIINMSSLLGIVSMPFRGAYNASKYAVEGLSDTLRLELKPAGIYVITIEPGPIASQFRDTAVDQLDNISIKNSAFSSQYQAMLTTYKQKKIDSIFTKNPNAVIEKLIHAVESKSPKPKYPVTFPAHFFSIARRLLSVKMLDRLLSYISRKELK